LTRCTTAALVAEHAARPSCQVTDIAMWRVLLVSARTFDVAGLPPEHSARTRSAHSAASSGQAVGGRGWHRAGRRRSGHRRRRRRSSSGSSCRGVRGRGCGAGSWIPSCVGRWTRDVTTMGGAEGEQGQGIRPTDPTLFVSLQHCGLPLGRIKGAGAGRAFPAPRWA